MPRRSSFHGIYYAQFHGPAFVAGQVEDSNYGHNVAAQAPRLAQLVAKSSF